MISLCIHLKRFKVQHFVLIDKKLKDKSPFHFKIMSTLDNRCTYLFNLFRINKSSFKKTRDRLVK